MTWGPTSFEEMNARLLEAHRIAEEGREKARRLQTYTKTGRPRCFSAGMVEGKQSSFAI